MCLRSFFWARILGGVWDVLVCKRSEIDTMGFGFGFKGLDTSRIHNGTEIKQVMLLSWLLLLGLWIASPWM